MTRCPRAMHSSRPHAQEQRGARRTHLVRKMMRSDASRSMRACAAAVLILRDARTPAPICGRACAFALLRMRTAITVQVLFTFQTAQLVPAARFCARVLHFGFAHPGEGWRSAERRTDACEASVGPALSGQARHLAR